MIIAIFLENLEFNTKKECKVNLPAPVFQKKGETMIFLTFNAIISHNFPENLIEISQVVPEDMNIYFLNIFINFLDFFKVLCCKKLITTSYNN